TAIINAYRIVRTSGSTKEHKEFRYDLVWNLINFANDDGGVKLRKNSVETKPENETKRPKATKHFELSDKWLIPGNHLVEWREQRVACRWCTWLANKNELDMDRKLPHRSSFWCVSCNEPLCCNNDRNCFLQFYTTK
ncbi:11130_t:CDS:1, partial [Scutellospora calospora]